MAISPINTHEPTECPDASALPTELEVIREEVGKCIACGNCLHACPVYAEEQDEGCVARGRNHLLKGLNHDPSELAAVMGDLLDKCLLCGRCTMACPQGVRNDLVIMAARRAMVRVKGLPLTKTVAFRRLMRDRSKMKTAMRVASRLQSLLPVTREQAGGLKHRPGEPEGKIRHLPLWLAGWGGGRQLPSIARTFLSDQAPEINSPAAGVAPRNLRVAYFAGCATEFCLPQVGLSLIRTLNKLGVEVVLPREQGCCGLAVFANGDFETAAGMARRNLEIFSKTGADLVVTACATCGSALKDGWSQLAGSPHEREQFEAFGRRVKDISELLVDLADYQTPRFRSRLPENTVVTYHDPCHLARYQRVTEQPRKILKQVFGADFVEMDHHGCCGCGGSFNAYHYDLSKQIGREKVESIARTHADAVINTCPGCMIQLIDQIERHNAPTRVVHLLEAVEPLDGD